MASIEQPKKPAGGGFGRFVAEKRPEFQAKCAGQSVAAVSKLAGESWKAFSEAEQAPYKKAFLEAQAKYTSDMEAFLSGGGVKQKGAAALRSEKRKAKEGALKPQKDPNAPKKPVGGAYGCFMAANRAEFQKQCSGPVSEVAKIASEKWKALPAGDKEKYEKEYKTKFEAYQEAKKSFVPLPQVVEEKDPDTNEPPAKKAKVSNEEKKATAGSKKDEKETAVAAKTGKRGKIAEVDVSEIPEAVLAKAEKSGMTVVLKKLICRDDIKDAKVSAAKALTALEAGGGLLHAARRALLGA